MTRDEAEAIAEAEGVGPIARSPAYDRWDIRAERRWTIEMTVAWIIWRQDEHVLESYQSYLDHCLRWKQLVAQRRMPIGLPQSKPQKPRFVLETPRVHSLASVQFRTGETRDQIRALAVLGLHHTKKGGADDPLEALSGSNGLSACADTTLVLDRDSNGITLYVRGRDVEEKESALSFASGIWTMTGDAATVRLSGERGNILVTLEQATGLMSPAEIADVTRMKPGNVRRLLYSMAKAGEVQKSGRGGYLHPENADRFGTDPRGGNNGNAVTKRGADDVQ